MDILEKIDGLLLNEDIVNQAVTRIGTDFDNLIEKLSRLSNTEFKKDYPKLHKKLGSIIKAFEKANDKLTAFDEDDIPEFPKE